MENAGSSSADGTLLETRLNARSTVSSSLAVQDLKRLSPSSGSSFLAKPPMMSCQYGVTSGLCIRPVELYQRLKLTQTDSALNASPSWNFTPLRSLKVQVVPAASGSQLSARPGTILVPPSSARTRVSKICRETRNDSPSLAKVGSRTFGSPATPKTRVSLLFPELPSRPLSAQPAAASAATATAAMATLGLDARIVLHLVLGDTDSGDGGHRLR